ncbi:alpha/beta hydrolase [Actinokineospora cianjurensis]|uniref:Alpha-beta hydrolase superfamily lysophospholipase n=1 Tax=Actinokineospora cianjurensis TaxID=585224 RepID=A0A421B2T4_9PSEU|nr:alpha/beta fold hydrolase [Actinokineospora cianjurensis]RLK58590.1 alpha-beta hydrolase superfamily lysophospholipase [Actinokineospora cianjurensis]
MSRYTDFPEPVGLRVRGTVIVVPGRGETQATYTRLGTRLAADAYRVRVLDAPDVTSLTRLADELTEAVDGADRPLVLIGADSGAAAIAALLSHETSAAPWWPDAVVLAGLPGHTAAAVDWAEELEIRTSCPAHREVLTNDPAVSRGALHTPLPPDLTAAAYNDTTDLPHLFLIGDEDPLADRTALTLAVKASPKSRLSVVRGAHHDVLNDRQHRSVAAEIITFLETLGNGLVPVIAVESSAW